MKFSKIRIAQTRVLALLGIVLSLVAVASASWKEKVLYSFQGGSDGAVPADGVIFDKQGNIYGATRDGGGTNCSSIYQCGTVYKLTPNGSGWTETVLYVFKGHQYGDGASPGGGLIPDAAGNLYGVTEYGGTGDCVLLGDKVGCGAVYEMTPPKTKGGAWTEKVIYSFPTSKQGYVPWGDLVFDPAGNLYGATEYGGGKGTTCNPFYQYCGGVYRLSPPKTKGGKWTGRVLYGFKGVATGAQFGDGANPRAGVVLDVKGNVYGTTFYGGNNQKGKCAGGSEGTGCGEVFELKPPVTKALAWTKRTIHRFNAQDGASPSAAVIFDKNGNLYGTLFAGLNEGNGGVFELKKPSGQVHSWTETVLHAFSGMNDGENPAARLVLDSIGNLYGASQYGSTFSGTAFRLKPPTRKGGPWNFGILHGFTRSGSDGGQPAANFTFDKSDNLYGTTTQGGTDDHGTVFELSP